jgi:hypothetical protein
MNDRHRTETHAATSQDRFAARESRTFRHWIAASNRLRAAERELEAARADERHAWRDYARSAHGDKRMTWSDRVADALRIHWAEQSPTDTAQ